MGRASPSLQRIHKIAEGEGTESFPIFYTLSQDKSFSTLKILHSKAYMKQLTEMERRCSDQSAKMFAELRNKTRLSQTKLASKMNFSRSTIAKREAQGDCELPALVHHFQALGCDPYESIRALIEHILKT